MVRCPFSYKQTFTHDPISNVYKAHWIMGETNKGHRKEIEIEGRRVRKKETKEKQEDNHRMNIIKTLYVHV